LIGIICALPEEVEGFLRIASARDDDNNGFIRLALGPFEAVIASCGLGKVNAAMTAAILIERWNCHGLVSAGTAGGLEGSRPMEVVIGTELIQHDYGRSRGPGRLELYPPGVPPLPAYQTDDFALRIPESRRRRFAQATGQMDHVRYGTFASGDTFVNDRDTRQRLIELGAIAVDMECAAVAQVAEFHALPWVVAKGISDHASTGSHEDFLEGLAEASRRSAEVVRILLPEVLS